MKQRLKRAFTITELVIVIAVIAVLAAVLIPTFASVIDESKKSHDTQYMKEINVAIADYTAMHGAPPEDYDDLMLVLADAGLCDADNPFLLATALKQDDMVLVWYPGTDKVRLVDTSEESMLFSSSRGYGNFVTVYTIGADNIGHEEGYYVLCNTGHKDSMAAAEIYRQLYVLAGGNVGSFLHGGSISDLVKDMENKSWANSIVSAFNNAEKGYTYDQGTASSILDAFKTTTNAQVDLTANLSAEDQSKTFSQLGDTEKTIVEQGVRGTLATLASLENDSKTKNDVAGKQVTFNVPEGTVVKMDGVTLTPIGQTYRKEKDALNNTPKSTLSVDYGGLTLANMKVEENTFTSTGAEMQKETDCGRTGGGYAFTYGMFGSVIAAYGQTVTIENLTIKNVSMNFKGAVENINGNSVNTFADNAGILIGYAQGNVVLKNITIDGANEAGERGLIAGYDAISGVVGRAYGSIENGYRREGTLKMENVHVKNLNIEGERRAAGFIGFFGSKGGSVGGGVAENVELQNCSLENVVIDAKRDENTDHVFPNDRQCWAMALANSNGSPLTADKIELTDVYTSVNFFGYIPSALTTFSYGEKDINVGELSYSTYAWMAMSEFEFTVPSAYATYDTLFLTRESSNTTVKNFNIHYTDASQVVHNYSLAGESELKLAINNKYTATVAE